MGTGRAPMGPRPAKNIRIAHRSRSTRKARLLLPEMERAETASLIILVTSSSKPDVQSRYFSRCRADSLFG